MPSVGPELPRHRSGSLGSRHGPRPWNAQWRRHTRTLRLALAPRPLLTRCGFRSPLGSGATAARVPAESDLCHVPAILRISRRHREILRRKARTRSGIPTATEVPCRTFPKSSIDIGAWNGLASRAAGKKSPAIVGERPGSACRWLLLGGGRRTELTTACLAIRPPRKGAAGSRPRSSAQDDRRRAAH